VRKPSPTPSPSSGPRADAGTAREHDMPAPVEDPQASPQGSEPETVTGTLEPEQPAEPGSPARSRPTRKARDTGRHKPSGATEAETTAEPADAGPGRAGAAPDPRRKPVVVGALLLAGLVLAGLAVWFKIEDNAVSSATGNTALLDVATTAQVKQDVGSAVETLFSYNYNDMAKTENAANDLLLTDAVKDKYNKELAEVKRLAPAQKMVVTCKVTRSAVIVLDGDRAKVLVFVDQTSTRTDQAQTAAGGSQLSVTAERRDGKWKISDLDAYSSGQPSPAAPAPAK
jgi:Mce-associated membrane protein